VCGREALENNSEIGHQHERKSRRPMLKSSC